MMDVSFSFFIKSLDLDRGDHVEAKRWIESRRGYGYIRVWCVDGLLR